MGFGGGAGGGPRGGLHGVALGKRIELGGPARWSPEPSSRVGSFEESTAMRF